MSLNECRKWNLSTYLSLNIRNYISQRRDERLELEKLPSRASLRRPRRHLSLLRKMKLSLRKHSYRSTKCPRKRSHNQKQRLRLTRQPTMIVLLALTLLSRSLIILV
jgi:transposase